jgi:TonB family protein
MYVASGSRILALERELRGLLVSAIPDISKLNALDADIKNDELRVGTMMLPCAEIKWRKHKDGTWPPVVLDVRAGSYCFEGSQLRVRRISNKEYIEFDHAKKIQDRIVAGEVGWNYNGRKMLTFSLDEIGLLANDKAELRPAADAKESAPEEAAKAILRGVKKQTAPVYPYEARLNRLSGSVIFDALIGADGKVEDIQLLASPSPILTKSAKEAVSRWRYTPYLLNGEPQEVSTRIMVIFEVAY